MGSGVPAGQPCPCCHCDASWERDLFMTFYRGKSLCVNADQALSSCWVSRAFWTANTNEGSVGT